MKKINILLFCSLILVSFSVSFVSAQVYINEIESNPTGTDANNEWVEIYNAGAPQDLTGWYITDRDANQFPFPAVTINDFYVLDGLDGLVNTSETVSLFDNADVLQDTYGPFDDGDNDDNTWQRSPDGTGAFVFQASTKGATNRPDLIVPDNYPTIQDAIDASIPGDIITVNPGTYTEDLIIPAGKDNLEIAAAGTTIKGVSNVDIAACPLAIPNIEILSDGVKIHGFTIESPDYVALKYTSGIVIGAKNVEIYDNDFIINSAGTIDEISQVMQTYAKAAVPGVDISGLNIHDNTFTHKNAAGTWGYEAIYINPDEGIGEIFIQNNQFNGEILRAITSERSRTTIDNNDIITDLIPSDLSFPGAWQGINTRNLANEDQSDIDITNNLVKGSDPTKGFNEAIRIGNAAQTLTDFLIKSNTLNYNANGILVKSANGVIVEENSIVGNLFGVQNDDASQLNAESNWWGDCLGPYHPTTNPSSQGDQVSDNVDYTPWIGLCITNKTNVTCPFESEDITLEANVSGLDIQDVWFSVGINGVYTNITATSLGGNIYSITISSADLTGGANVVWNVYATDPYKTYNNSWKEFSVLASTILNVDPVTPDGDNGWYITIPEFTLVPDPATMNSYYRWDRTPLVLYTAPFGLENAPNQPPESAGILDLTYFSECFSKNETNQVETYHIDVTSPEIGDENPENDTTIFIDDPLISAMIDEIYGSNSGVDLNSVVMKLDNIEVTHSLTSISGTRKYQASFQSTDLTTGVHEVELTAGDIAGNPLTTYTWHFEVGAAEEFLMTVIDPINDTNFSERRVDLEIVTNQEVDLEYNDNDGLFKRLCKDCTVYSRGKTFRDGYHIIKIRAILNDVILATEERNFLENFEKLDF